MNDLISRAAAIEAVTNADRNCLGAHGAREAIRALPSASQPEAEWTGMGGSIAPKLDPNCECVCHRQPGVMHVAPCCQPQPEAEPVAWRIRLAGDDPDEWTLHHNAVDYLDRPQFECQPLYLRHATAPVVPAEGLDALIAAAKAEAEKAMHKFPQPNYVISKVAEEAGEVVKAAIHCAEGRETPENVVAEIRQAMAMLFRLYLEGDQIHGLPPLHAQQPAAPVSGVTVQEDTRPPVERSPGACATEKPGGDRQGGRAMGFLAEFLILCAVGFLSAGICVAFFVLVL